MDHELSVVVRVYRLLLINKGARLVACLNVALVYPLSGNIPDETFIDVCLRNN